MVSSIYKGDFVYLNMHMEQVYTNFVKENSQMGYHEKSINYMGSNDFTFETIKRLESFLKENRDKNIVLDFQGKKLLGIQNNIGDKVKACITEKVYVINLSDELEKKLKLDVMKDRGKVQDYLTVFDESKFDCVIALRENQFYECSNGVILSKYINIKKLIENNNDFFKWSYMLCSNLIQNGLFKKYNKNEHRKPILLAHTLNGVCIATMVSKLMNLEMIYVDHLGPHNRITGINFLENFQAYQNYLLVVDFVCQGNEILRAQNIVEFIGGKYIGFISMIKLDISKISTSQPKEEIIKEAVIKISPDEAVKKLEYTINTKLCCKSNYEVQNGKLN